MAISLYIHIPFCTRKCPYCHFYVVHDKEELKDILLNGLLQELASWKDALHGRKLASIYFGGGTPILFGNKRIARVLEEIQKSIHIDADCEITIEANPENVDLKLLQELVKLGINRLSIGIQSFQEKELEILGRNHKVSKAEEAIFTSYEAGFRNISIDLMYEVPKQTEMSWHNSLEKVQTLPITHLSLYNLTIEPYTPFEKKEKSLRLLMPDDETSAKMYKEAISYLQSIGLEQYEISAFAKNGLISRHNIGYWTAREFIGLGPSAFSYFQGKRFRNIANLVRYAKLLEDSQSPIDFTDDVTIDDRRKELLAVNLRLVKGVNLVDFEKQHGTLSKETVEMCNKLQELELISQTQDTIALTEKGIFFYDTVASELI